MNEIVIDMPEMFSVEEAGQFRDDIKNCIQEGHSSFLLHFGSCRFIDSTGLGVIVSSYKKCVETGGTIRLTGMNDNVRKVFELTRLTNVFEIL